MVSATLQRHEAHIPLKYNQSWSTPKDPALLKCTDLQRQHEFTCHPSHLSLFSYLVLKVLGCGTATLSAPHRVTGLFRNTEILTRSYNLMRFQKVLKEPM